LNLAVPLLSTQAAVGTIHSRNNTLVRTFNSFFQTIHSFTLIIGPTPSVRVTAIDAAALCVTKEGFLSFDSLTLIGRAAPSIGVVQRMQQRLVIDPNCKLLIF
jgi:hypothetical protein